MDETMIAGLNVRRVGHGRGGNRGTRSHQRGERDRRQRKRLADISACHNESPPAGPGKSGRHQGAKSTLRGDDRTMKFLLAKDAAKPSGDKPPSTSIEDDGRNLTHVRSAIVGAPSWADSVVAPPRHCDLRLRR